MSPFAPCGALLNFTAATSAPTSVQATTLDNVEGNCYMLSNSSATISAVIGFGPSDAIAKLNAAAGTSVQNCVFLAPLGQIIIRGSRDAYFSGISLSSTAVVYVQAGKSINI